MLTRLTDFLKDERGQTLSEYGLIIGIVLVGLAALVLAFRDKVAEAWQKAINAFGG